MTEKKILHTILITYFVLIFFSLFFTGEATKMFPESALLQPSFEHIFGTDQYGRSVFLRVLVGGKILVLSSLITTMLGMGIGLALGLTAYLDSKINHTAILRMIDLWLSFPGLIITLLVVVYLGNSILSVIIGVTILLIPRVARVLYGAVAQLKTKEFIRSAKAIGATDRHIIFFYIIPNLTNTLLAESGIRFIHSISIISSVNFLGLGAQPPTADWGLMIAEGRQYIFTAPWIAFFPSLAISGLILTCNLLIDQLNVENSARSLINLISKSTK